MLLGCHVSRYHAAAKASIVAHIEVARQEALACQVDLRAFQIFVGGPNNRKINLKATEFAENGNKHNSERLTEAKLFTNCHSNEIITIFDSKDYRKTT